ncbi:DUF7064 domain-containing protein [Frankia sp. CiP1_Cm_nod2]|uniref:DUF7064 domain-containing protein n=1 Tax=Frankia sp. CiP1_Cm_nod2 TaxID=2897161 RepID=UPI0020241D79
MSVTSATGHIVESDDLRHRVAPGVKTRDSLFWTLVLPDERIAAQVYVWTDGRGVAGRQVCVYFPDRERNVVLGAFNVELGDASELDDWHCAGLYLRQPDPLRTAEIVFAGDEVSIDYRFEASHRPFSYRENPAGCPPWMAANRFEQAGRASGTLRIGERVIPFADVWAHRDHSWGRRHWSAVQHWKWLAAGTPSGAELNAMFHIARGELGVNGYVLRGGEPVAIVDSRHHATYDRDMGQESLEAELTDAHGGTTHLWMRRYAILHLPVGSDTLMSEAACQVTIDGEAGAGQFETLWPRGYLKRLVDAQ